MITPFYDEQREAFGRSYGLSSCGYDVRLRQTIWVWPFWGRKGSIIEYIDLPDDLSAGLKDKSTNARLMVFVANTVTEPGWRGYLTVELTRHKPWPIRLRRGTPIAQVQFILLDEATERPYSGKYQDQGVDPQPAKLKP